MAFTDEQAQALRASLAEALVSGETCSWPGLGEFSRLLRPVPSDTSKTYALLQLVAAPAIADSLGLSKNEHAPGTRTWIAAYATRTNRWLGADPTLDRMRAHSASIDAQRQRLAALEASTELATVGGQLDAAQQDLAKRVNDRVAKPLDDAGVYNEELLRAADTLAAGHNVMPPKLLREI